METFAVYWEPIIKTYGIAERTGLCLITLDLPSSRIGSAGDWLTRIASQSEGSLVLIFSRPASPSGLRLHLLMDRLPEHIENVHKKDAIKKNTRPGPPAAMNLEASDRDRPGPRVDNPVELIYFQGPHYGDRYGIASAAVTALTERGVPLLAVVCTGASVYLIIPKGMACAARDAIGKAFSSPEPANKPTIS